MNMTRFERSTLRKKALLHKDSLKHHLQDYCASTSIHGVKYLGNTTTRLEKCWWAAMLVCCIMGNGYLIHKVWIKWNNSPVIVSFAETAMRIWELPFPAITFCSEIQSKKDKFFIGEVKDRAISDTYNISDEEAERMGHLSLLCDDHIIINGEVLADNSTMPFLIEVAPGIDDLTLLCQFIDYKPCNCSELFTRIFTDGGVCYSFNMLSPSELFRGYGNPEFKEHGFENTWSLEKGYDPESDLYEAYPRRVISAGATSAMSLLFQYRISDTDHFCRGPVEGFKVLLHNPGEFPVVKERYFRVPLGQEVLLMVQPRIMTTSNGLRSYHAETRQCFFPSERYLAHFQIYTQRNCEIECLTNYTLLRCGCVALHMPRNESTPLCGAGKKICLLDAQRELKLIEIKAARDDTINSKCNCLQACQSIQYDAEISQAPFNASGTVKSHNDNLTEIEGYAVSRIKIFFKDMQFTTSRRSELFGQVDFLANCGGLLGLFCGISILSICEVVYYITIRLWSNVRDIKKKHESMEKSDSNRSQPRGIPVPIAEESKIQ